MSSSLPRRNILSSGAAMAATAVITHRSGSGGKDSDDQTQTAVVRWDDRLRRWAQRPPQADFGVVFLSTNDPAAPEPADVNCKAGDVWRRHPDAVTE